MNSQAPRRRGNRAGEPKARGSREMQPARAGRTAAARGDTLLRIQRIPEANVPNPGESDLTPSQSEVCYRQRPSTRLCPTSSPTRSSLGQAMRASDSAPRLEARAVNDTVPCGAASGLLRLRFCGLAHAPRPLVTRSSRRRLPGDQDTPIHHQTFRHLTQQSTQTLH